MKTYSTPILFAGALIASAFLSAQSAVADDTIVAWGPSQYYVSSYTDMIGLTDGSVTFSDSVARSPGLPYPNGQSSGTFYGGAFSDNASGLTTWRIQNNTQGANTNDGIDFGGALSNGELSTALYVWKKEDFLSGFSSTAAQVTSFSATLTQSGSSTLLSGSIRWVVQVADSYYVSEATTISTSFAFNQYILSDPTSVDWYGIDPSISLSAIGEQWVSPDLSDVSSVGLWFQLEASGSVSLARGIVTEYTVTAIPEPSSSSMVLLVVGLMFSLAYIKQFKR